MENKNQKTNRKYALYARVSNSPQNLGLESQLRSLQEYCSINKIENYEIFLDEGTSGTKSLRPSLDRLMGHVKNNQIECVIIFSFSRFARSITHLHEGFEIFRKYDCGLVSLSEKLDLNSSLGRAAFILVGAMAQLERDLIGERVKHGLSNAKANGRLIGRKKLRDSVLIRKLLQSGMSYRAVASVAGASYGSIAAEKKSMKLELAKQLRVEALAVEEELNQLNSEDQLSFTEPLINVKNESDKTN